MSPLVFYLTRTLMGVIILELILNLHKLEKLVICVDDKIFATHVCKGLIFVDKHFY